MKQYILILLGIAGLILIYSFCKQSSKPSSNTGIAFFEGTWEEALAKAKTEKKLIFLDAYASWCGPCKAMKKKTFSDQKVGELFNKYFISVAIDMERGQGPALANKFQVDSYPTLIFLQPDGKFLKKAVGYHSPDEFLEIVKQIAGI